MRVIICGGGTAGHIYPGLALADELRSTEKVDFLFVGPENGVDKTILGQTGYRLETLNIQGLPRRVSGRLFRSLALFAKSTVRANSILKEFRPDVVVGMGGYGSVPLVSVARARRIPTLIHEQNALPGLANRLLAKVVSVVAVSFPDTERFFPRTKRTVLTGNPVRSMLSGTARAEAMRFFDFDPQRKTLLVFGGSRGAQRINEALIQALPLFRMVEQLQILHVAGADNYEQVLEHVKREKRADDKLMYKVYPYLKEFGQAYAVADLAVARAGATTVAEIMETAVPTIFVPYPYAAEGHQEKNARFLVDKGAARLILDQDLTGQRLYEAVHGLIFDANALAHMREKTASLREPGAAEKLAGVVRSLASSKHAGVQ